MSVAYHLVRFEGWLDVSRYPEFRESFEALPRSTAVLVDLADAQGADSIFLSELLLARRRHKAPFAIVLPPTGNIPRLFAITGLDAKVDVYSDISTAVESLGIIDQRDQLKTD